MSSFSRIVRGLCSLLICLWAIEASAQSPAKKSGSQQPPKKSTLDKLDQQLEDDLLGDLDDIPSKRKTKKADSPQRAGEDIPRQPRKQSPLLRIGRQMRTVEERIASGDTSSETQLLQKQILEQLDAMIEQTCQKCSGGASGGKKPPSGKPGGSPGAGQGTGKAAVNGPQKSTQRLNDGKAENAELDTIKKTIYRVWGHLPPQVQKSMRSAAAERFLPKYQKLIEQYYKRLAEEAVNTP